jgi:hypothetical protein
MQSQTSLLAASNGQLNGHALASELQAQVEKAIAQTPIYDIHTHLYDPAFGDLLLYGIDDLLVYHYLVSEAFRNMTIPYEKFWSLSKTEQADLIWNALFVENSPVSESCRGVLTTLNKLGLDPRQNDLSSLRKWFAQWNALDYTQHCMELANVKTICMTNSPFDDLERPTWEQGFSRHNGFTSALRIDPLLMQWEQTAGQMQGWGYDVSTHMDEKTIAAVRRFLLDWTQKMDALYVMVSLPPSFEYPGNSSTAQLIEKAVLPFCRENNLPFAVMMGVKRAVNPHLQLAGDGVGKSDIVALENMAAQFPDTKFLVTMLSRENQHELCVVARKFRNIHVFGCWWFTNIPHLIDEMTQLRMELLGLSFTPQHSDARVLDQIIYKWDHSKEIIARVLTEKYSDLARAGWTPTQDEIERDVRGLFGGNFEKFLATSF